MTVDSKHLILTFLRNNGWYPGDPQAYQIAKYINDWGNPTYHVAYSQNEVFNAISSPAVHQYQALWHRTDGLTDLGKAELRDEEQERAEDLQKI